MTVVVAVLVGVVAGLASGIAGIGGGIVMVPAMVFWLGADQHTAQGTSALVIVFTAAAATVVNLRNRRGDVRAGILLGIGGVLTAFAGARLANALDADLLQRLFGLFVLANGIREGARALRARAARAQAS